MDSEGSAAAAGRPLDRRSMEQTLSGLAGRVFVMNNVHEDAPVVFESRWALSYLRGPLGRNEIKRLMAGRRAPAPAESAAPRAASSTLLATTPSTLPASLNGQPPILPAGISQYFIPPRVAADTLSYRPTMYGAAQVRYVDAKRKIDASVELLVMTPLGEGPVAIDWSLAEPVDVGPSDLETTPPANATFLDLPANVLRARRPDAMGEGLCQVGVREPVQAAQERYEALSEQLRAETLELETRFDAASEPIETCRCKPKKVNITVLLVALVWAPYASRPSGAPMPAW